MTPLERRVIAAAIVWAEDWKDGVWWGCDCPQCKLARAIDRLPKAKAASKRKEKV